MFYTKTQSVATTTLYTPVKSTAGEALMRLPKHVIVGVDDLFLNVRFRGLFSLSLELHRLAAL